MSTVHEFKQRIKETLSNREKRQIIDSGLDVSAVLIPIYEVAGEYYLLFIRRSQSVQSHKGGISFPGGKRDETDSGLMVTALREASEEIGLRPEIVEVLGELDDERTISSNFIVSPFAAFIPYPYHFEINPGKVEDLVGVPVSALRDRANWREDTVTEGGETLSTYSYHYQGDVIWGATARMIKKLLDLVFSED